MHLERFCGAGNRLVACFLGVALLLCAPLAWAEALEVQINGVDGDLLDNVRQSLSIEQQKDEESLSPARIRRLHDQAQAQIERALEPYGHYRVQVQSRLQHTEQGWLARYDVDPGPAVRITELQVEVQGEARDDPAFDELLQDFPIRQGTPLRHPRYEQAKNALRTLAAERGYFDAELKEHRAEVDLEAYVARVYMRLDSGRRYRFGAVRFERTVVNEDLLRDYIPFEQGDPYLSSKLLELQRSLIDSDYFERVEVDPQTDRSEMQEVPVQVTLTARARSRYSFGIGYGTDTGVRGSVGLERRYVNRRGHRFRTELQLSEIRNVVDARYDIPVRDPRTDRVFLRTRYSDEDLETSSSKTFEVGGGLERTLGLWRQVFSLTYLDSDFTVGTQAGHATLLMPGASWTRIKSDNSLYTRHGSRIGLDVRGAYEDLLSDTSFVQVRAHAKWIRSIGRNRILVRGEAGSTWVDDFSSLPPSIRFFAGGDYSVRGFAYQTLGPEDEAGNVIGGRHLLVGSVEYEHRIKEKWAAAVFYDAGNAINDFDDELEHSVGVGVRWRSPVGWVRVDLAKPLSESDESVRLHLTIGPDL